VESEQLWANVPAPLPVVTSVITVAPLRWMRTWRAPELLDCHRAEAVIVYQPSRGTTRLFEPMVMPPRRAAVVPRGRVVIVPWGIDWFEVAVRCPPGISQICASRIAADVAAWRALIVVWNGVIGSVSSR